MIELTRTGISLVVSGGALVVLAGLAGTGCNGAVTANGNTVPSSDSGEEAAVGSDGGSDAIQNEDAVDGASEVDSSVCVSDCWRKTSVAPVQPGLRPGAAPAMGKAFFYGGKDQCFDCSGNFLATGAIYDPGTDIWTAVPQGPAGAGPVTWSDAAFFIFGSGLWTYPFAASSWAKGSDLPTVSGPLGGSVWLGDTVVHLYGRQGTGECGIRVFPSTGKWEFVVPPPEVPCAGSSFVLAMDAKVLVWGGDVSGAATDLGFVFDPAAKSWTPVVKNGAPSPRKAPVGVWTGTEAIVFSGADTAGHVLKDGALFDPVGNSWRPVTSTGAPAIVSKDPDGPSAVWAAGRMVFWDGAGNQKAAALYDPDLDEWTPMNLSGGPDTGGLEGLVWTGTELVVWGGRASGGSGWVYKPPPKKSGF